MNATSDDGRRRKWLVALVVLGAGLGAITWLWLNERPRGAAPRASQDTATQAPITSEVTVSVTAAGKPLADVGVLLQHVSHDELFFTERSNAAGEARFPAIPKGVYRLTTMQLGYESRSRNIGVTGPEHRWTVKLTRVREGDATAKEGDAAEQEPAQGGSVSGIVVNADGVPLANAQVGASGLGTPRFTTTDADGHFELSALTGDEVNLFMTHESYSASHLHGVAVGRTDVKLVASAPSEVSGQLQFDKIPEQLFVRLCRYETAHRKEVCIKSEYSKPPKPSYQLTRVPAGDFSLVFWDGQQELLRLPVKVEPGQHVEVPLQRL